jgi:uncharacterized damage-inducible protein DinB
MNALDLILGFAENNAWANLRIYSACSALSDSDRRAMRTSFFPTIHATLTHIALVDEYYLDALQGGGKGRAVFANEDPFDTFDDLMEAQRALDQRLVAHVRQLKGETDLDAVASLERQDHVQTERVGDVLLHLFQHQVHHRGQVHAMLAGTSVAPPQLDEFFLADELPLRRPELLALGLRVR